MTEEIERKFLLREEGKWFDTKEFEQFFPTREEFYERFNEAAKQYWQGYLYLEDAHKILEILNAEVDFFPNEARLRTIQNWTNHEYEDRLFTLKGQGSLTRREFEVSLDDKIWREIEKISFSMKGVVAKARSKIPYLGKEIEFDNYQSRDLLIAEVEFKTEAEAKAFPELGIDVTNDSAYKNKNLARNFR